MTLHTSAIATTTAPGTSMRTPGWRPVVQWDGETVWVHDRDVPERSFALAVAAHALAKIQANSSCPMCGRHTDPNDAYEIVLDVVKTSEGLQAFDTYDCYHEANAEQDAELWKVDR